MKRDPLVKLHFWLFFFWDINSQSVLTKELKRSSKAMRWYSVATVTLGNNVNFLLRQMFMYQCCMARWNRLRILPPFFRVHEHVLGTTIQIIVKTFAKKENDIQSSWPLNHSSKQWDKQTLRYTAKSRADKERTNVAPSCQLGSGRSHKSRTQGFSSSLVHSRRWPWNKRS